MGAYEKGLRCYKHSKLRSFPYRLACRQCYLLLIMLAGLLGIRRRGGCSLEFGHLLWKQVGQERF